MNGAIAKATELLEQTPDSWMPQQFENPANIEVHARTTAQEIAADFPTASMRSSPASAPEATSPAAPEALKSPGRAQGVCRRAQRLTGDQRRPAQPASDPGHRGRLHPAILDTALLDGVIQVEAEARTRDSAPLRARGRYPRRHLSGATLAAIAQKLPELAAGARVLGFNYDTGERYLSVEGFLPIE